MLALTSAGWRAIAPDLRGMGASSRPGDYRVGRSVADMVAVLNTLGVEKATVVGHDWGAAVAWALAATQPDRVERLVAMSVGQGIGILGAVIFLFVVVRDLRRTMGSKRDGTGE